VSAAHHGASRRSFGQGLVLIVVVASLVLLALLSTASRDTGSPQPASFGPSSVAPSSADSSSYTCGGFTPGASSAAPGRVLLSNTTAAPRSVTISVVDDAGRTALLKVVAPAGVTTPVEVSTAVTGGLVAAANVLVEGGGVGVSEETEGPGGTSAAQCASSTSSTWYLVGGTSPDHASLVYSLINPTVTPAVVNVTFSTPDGIVVPQLTQGLVVAAHSVVLVQANQVLPHVSVMAGIVRATQGTLVAFATQQTPTPGGSSVTLGIPTLSRLWVQPRGVATPGTQSSLLIDNPSPAQVHVTITVRVPSGLLPAWTEEVGPFSVFQLQVSPASRVPLTDTYTATIQSDGPGVAVAQMVMSASARSGGWGVAPLVAPAASSARSWLLPGSPSGAPAGVSVVAVGGSVTIHASVLTAKGAEPVPGLDGVQLEGDAQLSTSAAGLALMGRSPVLISASGPLAVGEDLTGTAAPGVATIAGIPQRP
jgi:hypothetical protein